LYLFCLEITLHGIHRLTVDPDFEMQVVARGQAGAPDLRYGLSCLDLVSYLDKQLACVGIQGRDAAAVVYDHHVPVAGIVIPGHYDGTTVGRNYGCPLVRGYVDAGVHLVLPEDRMLPHPERGRHPVGTWTRPCHRSAHVFVLRGKGLDLARQLLGLL